jgi:hypothetical protein
MATLRATQLRCEAASISRFSLAEPGAGGGSPWPPGQAVWCNVARA